jgi:hypothetical protein
MTALQLIPQLSRDAWIILSALFAVVMLFTLTLVAFEHIATQWQADQYDAGQGPTEGQLTRRTLHPRVPEQRESGDLS